jgi:CRISPR/Cas system CSM-associated protein Csm3 (group 7 of RAMP superfamily)
MSFQTRWCITGTLTTVTPLHIGSGTTTNEHEKLRVEDEKGERGIDVTAIALDGQGKPYIPGSTLKGNLRAWLQTRTKCSSLLNNVFGSGDEEKGIESQGGKAEFWNVLIKEPLKKPEHLPSYWHEQRQVGVEVGVTIDRVTRTAREQRLFHREMVPPNVSFEVRITGKGLDEDEVALLLASLNGFNDEQERISLGSDNAQNKGLMDWKLQEIKILDEDATKNWIAEGASGMWYSALEKLDKAKQDSLLQKSNDLIYEQSNKPILQLHFQLIFDSPFLVNDPSLFDKNDSNSPNHQPRCDHRGKAVLPSSSLRGAIRAQAERIIRTLEGKACLIDDEKSACPPIEKYKEVEQLCLACQLFGATGWQSPIRISDFTLVKVEKEKLKQEFVAIDRFTGGGAEHLKFNAESVYKPTFEGYWKIDLQRVKPWSLGLLALVIRDLIEGDITFGYGAAKGYGHCYAKLKECSVSALPSVEDYPDWKKFVLNLETIQEWQGNKAVLPEIQNLINSFVNEFQDKCKITAKITYKQR